MSAVDRLGLGFAVVILAALVATPAKAVESHGASRGRSGHPRVIGVIGGPAVIVVEAQPVVYQRTQPAAPRLSPAAACPSQRETYVDGAGVSHSQIRRSCF